MSHFSSIWNILLGSFLLYLLPQHSLVFHEFPCDYFGITPCFLCLPLPFLFLLTTSTMFFVTMHNAMTTVLPPLSPFISTSSWKAGSINPKHSKQKMMLKLIIGCSLRATGGGITGHQVNTNPNLINPGYQWKVSTTAHRIRARIVFALRILNQADPSARMLRHSLPTHSRFTSPYPVTEQEDLKAEFGQRRRHHHGYKIMITSVGELIKTPERADFSLYRSPQPTIRGPLPDLAPTPLVRQLKCLCAYNPICFPVAAPI